MSCEVPKATLQLRAACWEGSALPRPGQPQLSPMWAHFCGCHICSLWTLVTIQGLNQRVSTACGPLCGLSLEEGACPGQRGCSALMGSMIRTPSTLELPCAVLQGLFGDKPAVTHWAGFPQHALKHQLHHFVGGVLRKSGDTVLPVCWEGQKEAHGAVGASPEEAQVDQRDGAGLL